MPSPLLRKTRMKPRKVGLRRTLFDRSNRGNFGGTIEELPAGSLKESGTNTRAVIVTLDK